MEAKRDHFFSGAILSLCQLFEDSDLPWIRLKYSGRYRRLRIFTVFAIFALTAFCVLLTARVRRDRLWPDENLLLGFSEHNGSGPISVSDGCKITWTKSYDVEFAPEEELLVVAELYEVGKPMRPLGQKILTGSTDPQRFTVTFTRTYKDETKTIVGHSTKIQSGEQVFEIPEFTVSTKWHLNGEVLSWFPGGALRKLRPPRSKKDEGTPTRLFAYRLEDIEGNRPISVPALGISSGENHRVVLNITPASGFKCLVTEPAGSLRVQDK
ncbi:MAG: hypothetical protein ACYS76_02680 [Planctomycetota bacterium]